jgi:hypothetical protein
MLINNIIHQKVYAQTVDLASLCHKLPLSSRCEGYTSPSHNKNSTKVADQKARRTLKMKLKTPSSSNEWLRIEVNGNTVKLIHTSRAERNFSGIVNTALGAVSPVPLPGLHFHKWQDSPTTRVVFESDSCSTLQSPQTLDKSTPKVNQVSPQSQTSEDFTPQVNQTSPQSQTSEDFIPQVNQTSPQSQTSEDFNPQVNQTSPQSQTSEDFTPQVNQTSPQSQTSEDFTLEVNQVSPPPQAPEYSNPKVNQTSPPPQAPEYSNPKVNQTSPPPQTPENSNPKAKQPNFSPNCAIAGTDSVVLEEGTDIRKGRFTIEYTEGDLLRSITFRIPAEAS